MKNYQKEDSAMPPRHISVTHQPTATIKTERTQKKRNYIRPAVDFFETERNLTVVAFMPGVDKESLGVNIDQGVLIIRGDVDVVGHDDSLFRDFFQGSSYYRQVEVADDFDSDKVSTDFKNGVLTLTLAKARNNFV